MGGSQSLVEVLASLARLPVAESPQGERVACSNSICWLYVQLTFVSVHAF